MFQNKAIVDSFDRATDGTSSAHPSLGDPADLALDSAPRLAAQGATRAYPVLSPLPKQAVAPISFVVVHFSNEYQHNFLASACVNQERNQIIAVDNRGNWQFENLGMAVNAGIVQARHEIIAVVHEDVLLPGYWEQHLFRAIAAIEQAEIPWGLLGTVGWTHGTDRLTKGEIIGHWSDPKEYTNTLDGRLFQIAGSLDEHLLILRRSAGMRLDARLPSIHNIGVDLPLSLERQGLATLVINAPSIHKYADGEGRLIAHANDSPKILDRDSLAYRADKSLSDDYLIKKWTPECLREGVAGPRRIGFIDALLPRVRKTLRRLPGLRLGNALKVGHGNAPVLLIAKGGGGSRLLSLLAADLGLFIGERLNESGDALDLVLPVYRAMLRRCLVQTFAGERDTSILELGTAIRAFAARAPVRYGKWGFKLPESIFVLDELLAAFPQARVIHLLRDPLATALRRSHMTARLDNQIGRASVPCAYRHCGIDPILALSDPQFVRSAYCIRHQLETALNRLTSLPPARVLTTRFEDLLADAASAVKNTGAWLHREPVGNRLATAVSATRGQGHVSIDSDAAERAAEILHGLRQRLGYEPTVS